MQITVLGATGGIGRAIVDELVQRGHQVTAVNRSGDGTRPGVSGRAADLSSATDAHAACAGAEAVVMAAQPPYPEWVQHFPAIMRNVIDATASAGARLVFTDNLYAYAPADGVLTEDSPEHATDPKGSLRRELGQMMLDAHRSGRIRAAIGRFSDYYGPHGVNSGLYVTSIWAGIKGRTMRGLVDLDQPHTYHYLPDAARGFAELVERPDADGRVWLLPAAPPITQRDLLALINAALPRPVKIGTVTPLMLRLAGPFNPMIRETRSVTVQFDRPWEVDASRFVAELGPIELTPHERAVGETMAFFRSTQQAAAA